MTIAPDAMRTPSATVADRAAELVAALHEGLSACGRQSPDGAAAGQSSTQGSTEQAPRSGSDSRARQSLTEGSDKVRHIGWSGPPYRLRPGSRWRLPCTPVRNGSTFRLLVCSTAVDNGAHLPRMRVDRQAPAHARRGVPTSRLRPRPAVRAAPCAGSCLFPTPWPEYRIVARPLQLLRE
jgi:hypothetical protein